jgi:mono/diheme cytochrome c family protein
MRGQHGLAAACAGMALVVLAQQAPHGDATLGKAAFMKNMCYTCHGTAGQGGDRGSGPKLAPGLSPWEAFQQQVRHPLSVMPRYAREFVSDADLQDIYAYLASVKAGPAAKDIPLLRE